MTEDQIVDIILPFINKINSWKKCYYIIEGAFVKITDDISIEESEQFVIYPSIDGKIYKAAFGFVSGCKDEFIELKKFNEIKKVFDL